jgi:hypothetical protein
MNLFHKARSCAIVGLSLACGLASAMTRATTAGGQPYVSGGVGQGELRTLEAERDRYSLWAITAARHSGAYLADVRVRIVDVENGTVFDGRLDGPWLLIDLPRGRYSVEATYKDQTHRKTTSISAGDHRQMVFYFDAPGDVVGSSQPAAVR